MTPTKLQLDIRRSYTLVFKKEGEPDQLYELRNYVGAGWVTLDIFLLVPLIVDAGTQEWNYFSQESVTVCLASEVVAETAARKAKREEMAAKRADIPACNMSATDAWKSASPDQKKRWMDECSRLLPAESVPYPCLSASPQPAA